MTSAHTEVISQITCIRHASIIPWSELLDNLRIEIPDNFHSVGSVPAHEQRACQHACKQHYMLKASQKDVCGHLAAVLTSQKIVTEMEFF